MDWTTWLQDAGKTLLTTGAEVYKTKNQTSGQIDIANAQTGQDTVLAAMQSAENDKRGSIDQKTVVVLGIAAAAALVIVKGKN